MPDISEFHAFLNLYSGGQSREASAQASAAYTGSPRLHLSIGAAALRDFIDDFVTTHKAALTPEAALPLLEALYRGATIEEPILAGLLLAKLPKVRQSLPLDTFSRWLGLLTGWVEVDSTCQSTFAPRDVFPRWDEWAPFLHSLSADVNINKQRASLVLLIRTVREADDPRGITLALRLADNLKPERDKLISKAISWLLREAAKRHSRAVAAYLDTEGAGHAAHVVREVRKKLATGKKS